MARNTIFRPALPSTEPMSLKAVHLIFVTLLTALAFGCAAWAFQSGSTLWGVTGIGAGIFVIVYGIYFLKKLKNVSYL